MKQNAPPTLSRRGFLALSAVGIAGVPLLLSAEAAGAPTAREVADRIREQLGGSWEAGTVDGFKAGDPQARVTGIVTTALASMQVLRSAVKLRANLVITSEPTYFSKADTPTAPVRRPPGAPIEAELPQPQPDPVFQAKAAYIRDHGLVVLRLNEHWFAQQPNPFRSAMAASLGWSKVIGKADTGPIAVPETSLEALANHVKQGLGSNGGIRVVGDPRLRVRGVGLLPGSTPVQASLQLLPQVDAIIAGEVREWESVEYVRDTVALGGGKALILVGRIVSEEPGMKACAAWLKPLVPAVPTTWCSAGDPYWRPRA